MSTDVTIVISAAGMGTRLGLNRPKAMAAVAGKPMLEWQLQQFSRTEDVVVVAGYHAPDVVALVRRVRPMTAIALNHRFSSTGTAASVGIGARIAAGWIVSLDGDLLVSRASLDRVISHPSACLGLMPAASKAPVFAHVGSDDSVVTGLSQDKKGTLEWTGLVKLPRDRAVQLGTGHVFQGLLKSLPLQWVTVHSVEVDEPEDLDAATTWIESGGFEAA